jgi:hypothetical protein
LLVLSGKRLSTIASFFFSEKAWALQKVTHLTKLESMKTFDFDLILTHYRYHTAEPWKKNRRLFNPAFKVQVLSFMDAFNKSVYTTNLTAHWLSAK